MFDKGKPMQEVVRLADFRHRLMLMVEGYLRLAGYMDTVAILGNRFSFNLKSSKHTMTIFELGTDNAVFHTIMYELAYINISSMTLMSASGFKVEPVKFDPSIKIKVEQTVYGRKDFTEAHANGTYAEVAERSLREALEWYAGQTTLG
jgi:hypothetical protein